MTDRVGIVMTVSTDVPTQLPEEIIDIGRFSDYSKMLYVTALIILSVRKRTFKGINQQIDALPAKEQYEALGGEYVRPKNSF